MRTPKSLFERLISRPRSLRATLGITLPLFLLPIAGAYVDGRLDEFFRLGQWRGILLTPAVITYILVVCHRLSGVESHVLETFRPVVLVDDKTFERLVTEAVSLKLRNELFAIGAGVLFGILGLRVNLEGSFSWLILTWFVISLFMYGMLAWTIYISIASTKLTTTLLRQPLRVDPFDITPFEPIGRQSLLLALVFVGGITLSLIFIAFDPESFRTLEFWIVYIPLFLVPVLVFFMNNAPTHRVLAAAKNRELEAVRGHLHRSSRKLLRRLDTRQDTGNLPAEINALVAYEQQLQAARTWPYNTTMLRTLFFSVLIPGGTVVGRLIVERIYR